MFSPVGSQPPSVYWRRRLVLLATFVVLLLLIVLTVRTATSGASGAPQAGSPGPRSHAVAPAQSSSSARRHPSSGTSVSPAAAPRAATASTATASRPARGNGNQSALSNTSRPEPSTSSAPPPACRPADLQVRAYVPQTTYHVGQKPDVELQVTDISNGPCVQDLADRQIELQVYNGESRVWGSHDCQVQPGTNDRMLSAGQTVRVSITWSGFTSTPGCHGTRQRVGAGTYTLYASLSGRQGAATQFSIV